MADESVVSTAQLDCRLLPGELVVAFIKRENVLQASWLILKVALYSDSDGEDSKDHTAHPEPEESREDEEFAEECTMRAMVLDGDGCTLVLDKKHLLLLHDAGLSHIVDVAPPVWRAFEFNLGHTVADVPGVINHLARLLSEDDISTLHFSTYGSDIFLVQDSQVSRAISCIRKKVSPTLDIILEQRSSSVPLSTDTDSEGTVSPLPGSGGAEDGPEVEGGPGEDMAAAVSRIMLQRLNSRKWKPCVEGCPEAYDDGGGPAPRTAASPLVLRVLPKSLLLARIKKEYVKECAWTLIKLWLFGESFREYGRRGAIRRVTSLPAASVEPGAAPFTGGAGALVEQDLSYKSVRDFGPLMFCEMEGEITLLLREEDYRMLSPDGVVACPQGWVPIKLCGRKFDFNETGVVSAMSKVDSGVSILNVSTFVTNVTLVERANLEQTLDTLSAELDASIDGF